MVQEQFYMSIKIGVQDYTYFIVNLLICYKIVDMKFVRQNNRQRQPKSSACLQQQQNKPPMTNQTGLKQDIPSQICSMEDQAVEPHRKEEDFYLDQIVAYLANLPTVNKVDPDYFDNQSDITAHMRSVLLNWLIDVHLKYKLQPQTLFITIHILDAYLSKVQTGRTRLQLVGIVALWIASKYEQTYQVPKVSNLVFICDSTYTKSQILDMETHIIQVIDFNLLFTTQLHYLDALNRISNFQSKDYYLCRYILELCLFNVKLKKFNPKTIACSTVYFVRKLRKIQVCWTDREKQLLQISELQLKQCAREVCIFWQGSQGIQTLNSLKNKFQSVNYKEVSKIKIGQPSKGQFRA